LEGVDRVRFEEYTGYTIEQLAGPSLQTFLDQGLLENTATHLRLTRRGLLVSDSLWPEFLRC